MYFMTIPHAYRFARPLVGSSLSHDCFATPAPTRRRATAHALAEIVIASYSPSRFLHQFF
jgi:hypothetical protein